MKRRNAALSSFVFCFSQGKYKNTGRIIFVLLFLFHLSEGLNFVLNCQIIPNFTFFYDKIQLIKIPSGCQSSHCGMPQNVVKTLNSSEQKAKVPFTARSDPLCFMACVLGFYVAFGAPESFSGGTKGFNLAWNNLSTHPGPAS